MIVKYPSLETRWIRPLFKDVRQPLVVFNETPKYSGAYYKPHLGEAFIDGRFIPCDTGIIEISPASVGEPLGDGSTLAHEWRHHLQRTHFGWQFDGALWDVLEAEQLGYEESIRRYFRKSRTEADALGFQLRAAPCPLSVYFDELARRKCRKKTRWN